MMTANVNYGAGVKTRHRDFTKAFEVWQKVRHAVSGDLVSYLRDVGKNEPDPEYGRARQKEYEDGAICYNFTKRTLSGMVGAVMRKEPEQTIPAKLEYLLENADGSGGGLAALAGNPSAYADIQLKDAQQERERSAAALNDAEADWYKSQTLDKDLHTLLSTIPITPHDSLQITQRGTKRGR